MGTDSSKAVKAGIGYTIGNYLIKGLTFLTIPIFSRLLSTAEYGEYNSFVAYETILFVLIGVVLHGSYKNAKYEFKEAYNSYVSTTLLFIVANTAFFLVIANVFSAPLQSILGLDQWSINLLVLYSFSTAIINCYTSYLSLEYQYRNFILVSFINAVSTIGVSILLMLSVFDENRYMGRVIGTVVPVLLISLFLIVSFWKKSRPRDCVKHLKWGLNYSLPLVPHGLSQVVLTQFDRIMIRKLVGAAETGIYSFAYNIFAIVNITTNSLGTVWEPWFFEKMHNNERENIKKVSSLYALGMLVFSAMVILAAPEIIMILGTSEYYMSVYCVVPIVAGGYFAFLYNIPACVEYFYGKTKFIALGTMSAAAINIVLNYVFITQFGYIAAAYTTLISYIAYFVFHYIVAWKIEGKCLFDTRVIVFCGICMVAINFFGIAMIPYWFIRWGAVILLGVIAIIVEEKHMGLIKKVLKGDKYVK